QVVTSAATTWIRQLQTMLQSAAIPVPGRVSHIIKRRAGCEIVNLFTKIRGRPRIELDRPGFKADVLAATGLELHVFRLRTDPHRRRGVIDNQPQVTVR